MTEDLAKLEKEIEKAESEIGMFAGMHGGKEQVYDPHNKAPHTSIAKLYRARNGAVMDISDDEQAQELLDQGLITLVVS